MFLQNDRGEYLKELTEDCGLRFIVTTRDIHGALVVDEELAHKLCDVDAFGEQLPVGSPRIDSRWKRDFTVPVCPYGVRHPHECKPCADAAWERRNKTEGVCKKTN